MGGRAPPSRLTLNHSQRAAAGDVTRARCESLFLALAMALGFASVPAPVSGRTGLRRVTFSPLISATKSTGRSTCP